MNRNQRQNKAPKDERRLLEVLRQHSEKGPYPLHMPGHKRIAGSMGDVFTIDMTEAEGLDDLHHPEGILKEAQERAAALRGAGQTFFLVNGSTGGILTAVSACFGPDAKGRRLLMARNCHRSVYHAAVLEKLDTAYLWPQLIRAPKGTVISGAVDPADVASALEKYKDIGAVCITSPTYDGVVSDIAAIAKIAHEKGIPLIVDEAHGAHFGFHPAFPESAANCGADIVVQSLHKTLPALTQSALLHLNGSLVSADRIRRYLDIYQTSSPSYVLMASMDECVRLISERGEGLFEEAVRSALWFREQSRDFQMLEIVNTDDPSRIVIGAGRSGLSGEQICAILRERFHMECELAAPGYALALMSAADGRQVFEKLLDALQTIDREAAASAGKGPDSTAETSEGKACFESAPKVHQEIPLWEGWQQETQTIELADSVGRISGDFIYLYPPGIPFLAPGERIDKAAAAFLEDLPEKGSRLRGMEDERGMRIRVLTRP